MGDEGKWGVGRGAWGVRLDGCSKYARLNQVKPYQLMLNHTQYTMLATCFMPLLAICPNFDFT